MKKLLIALVMFACMHPVKSQSDEIQQLLLNVEKLSQFKKILQNMYDGYKILYTGYTKIKDVSEGNFNIHNTFLDGLFLVSPGVRKYKKIADIINYQVRIVNDSKAALKQFQNDKQFTVQEVNYIGDIYKKLLQQGLKSTEELLMVITARKLRMTDDDRLKAIDRIYVSIEDQFFFLKDFNSNTAMLSLQRKSAHAEIEMSKTISRIR